MQDAYPSGVALAVTGISSLALAQGAVTQAKSAEAAKAAIEGRQNLFKEIKTAYEPMTDMLKGKLQYDSAQVSTNAAKLQELVQKIPAHFTVDTRQYKDIKTLARDTIWTNLPDIKAKSDAVVTAVVNVAAVAKTNDKSATLKAISEIGKGCGACHDSYKDKP